MRKLFFMITFLMIGLFAAPAFAEIKQYSSDYAVELLDFNSESTIDVKAASTVFRIVEYEPYNVKMAIDAVENNNYEYALAPKAIEPTLLFEVGWRQV